LKNQIGLALGGGGARGSYQIGVLRAFEEANILKKIKHVSGTSIGAINALMVMAKLPYEKMIELWERITNEQIYGSGLDRFKLDRLGLFSLQELYEKLSKEVSLSEIRESKIQGYATAAKIHKNKLVEQVLIHRMEKEVFHLNNYKDPHKAVLASASIPLLFGSTGIEEETFVDGGIVDNCPIDPLLEAGCDIIIAVPINGGFHEKDYQNHDILLASIESKKLFSITRIDVLDFKPKDVKQKAEYGYAMGKLILSKMKQLGFLDDMGNITRPEGYYYIDISKEEEKILKHEVTSTWT